LQQSAIQHKLIPDNNTKLVKRCIKCQTKCYRQLLRETSDKMLFVTTARERDEKTIKYKNTQYNTKLVKRNVKRQMKCYW